MDLFQSKLKQSISSNILCLTIMPTEQCCFRCDYCYEDFSIGKMTQTTQNSIANFVKNRSSKLDLLQIEWFGGEPLMAKDVIYSLSENFKALSEKHSIRYAASMTTNAYLLDKECFEKLADLGVNSYQITFDGPELIHDQTRKRVDGKGTFRVIYNNLKAIKTSKKHADITLRIHYRPDTWEAVLSLIDDLNAELLDDPRFNVIFRPVGKWGGANDENLTVFEDKNDQAWVEKQLLKRLFGEVPKIEPTDDFYVCYASKANNFVIRANGNLAKCTVALSHPTNDVGYIKEDGSLHIKQDEFKKWLVGFQTGDLKQLACPAGTVLSKKNNLKSIPVVVEAA